MYKKLIKLSHILGVLGIKKEQEIINILIKEAASKANALRKMGFSEKISADINDICRGYSLWIAHALINNLIDAGNLIDSIDVKKENGESTVTEASKKEEAIKYIEKKFISTFKDEFSKIMDWVNGALNGDYKPYRNSDYATILRAAEQWHQELKESVGDINYVEENEIIIDFRDPDGQGFYWADLDTYSCSEESERMGHCGTSSTRANLYSLRRVVKINKSQMLNKSVLTAAINSDGMVVQLKGAKNSKPKEAYHKYIEALLLYEEDGDNLVKGFRSEYDSESDFNIADIKDDDSLRKIIKENPYLLDQTATKILVGIRLGDDSIRSSMSAEIKLNESFFELFSSESSRGRYRDYLTSRTIYEIFSGSFDEFDMISHYEMESSHFKATYNNDIDERNKNIILDIYKNNKIEEINNSSTNEDEKKEFLDEISSLTINSLLDYALYSEMKEFRIVSDVSYSDEICSVQSQVSQVYDIIIKFLSNFGKVDRGSDILHVNLFDIIKDAISSSSKSTIVGILYEIEEDNIYDINNMAEEFIRICSDRDIFDDKLQIDMERIYGDCKKEDFNEILHYQLNNRY